MTDAARALELQGASRLRAWLAAPPDPPPFVRRPKPITTIETTDRDRNKIRAWLAMPKVIETVGGDRAPLPRPELGAFLRASRPGSPPPELVDVLQVESQRRRTLEGRAMLDRAKRLRDESAAWQSGVCASRTELGAAAAVARSSVQSSGTTGSEPPPTAPAVDGSRLARYATKRGRIVEIDQDSPTKTASALDRACFLDDDSWLSKVEAYTADFRRSRARLHRHRQLEALSLGTVERPDGDSIVEPDPFDLENLDVPPSTERGRSTARWHKGRERGALERFGRVRDCGKGRIQVHCRCCQTVREQPAFCACPRVCVGCRARSAKRRQARVCIARGLLFRRASRSGLLSRSRKGGRWSEKMLTLTIPHITEHRFAAETGGSSETRDRIELVNMAWRHFSRSLNRWATRVRKTSGGIRAPWYRAFEWTPGFDRKGHPHLHCWLFGPFLPFDRVREWWADALVRAGFEKQSQCEAVAARCAGTPVMGVCATTPTQLPMTSESESPRCRRRAGYHVRKRCRRSRGGRIGGRRCARRALDVIIDIRGGWTDMHREIIKGEGKNLRVAFRTGPGADIIRYLDGWTIVDVDDNGHKIDPEVAARVYEALEARRIVQASRGFLVEKARASCFDCGTVGGLQAWPVPMPIGGWEHFFEIPTERGPP